MSLLRTVAHEPAMPERSQDALRERASAALVAGAIGDALGWPNEAANQRLGGRRAARSFTGRFVAWTRRSGGRFLAHRETIAAGDYSDDTQLVIATARALRRGGPEWFSQFTRVELPAWLMYERGAGRAVKAAAQSWAKGVEPWTSGKEQSDRFFGAGGNGAAMRVFPHAISAVENDRRLRAEVLLNGLATHGHPRGLAGALLYAAAGSAALQHSGSWRLGELLDATADLGNIWRDPPGEADASSKGSTPDAIISREYREVWVKTVGEIETGLNCAREAMGRGALAIDAEILEELGAFDPKRQGTGATAAIIAIFLASRYAADAATGVRVAAYAEGSDTDTIAAMTATLLGAMLGSSWIPPEWQAVQDYSLLNDLGDGLCRSHSQALELFGRASRTSWTEHDSRQLREQLTQSATDVIEFGPLGEVRVVGREVLPPIAKSVHAERWQLRSSEGQTVYVTRISKPGLPKGSPAQKADETQRDVAPVKDLRAAVNRSGRALADLEALRGTIETGLGAKELLIALEGVMRALGSRFGHGQQAEPPSWEGLVVWLRAALGEEAPNLSDSALHLVARVGWRLLYGSSTRRSGGKAQRS